MSADHNREHLLAERNRVSVPRRDRRVRRLYRISIGNFSYGVSVPRRDRRVRRLAHAGGKVVLERFQFPVGISVSADNGDYEELQNIAIVSVPRRDKRVRRPSCDTL